MTWWLALWGSMLQPSNTSTASTTSSHGNSLAASHIATARCAAYLALSIRILPPCLCCRAACCRWDGSFAQCWGACPRNSTKPTMSFPSQPTATSARSCHVYAVRNRLGTLGWAAPGGLADWPALNEGRRYLTGTTLLLFSFAASPTTGKKLTNSPQNFSTSTRIRSHTKSSRRKRLVQTSHFFLQASPQKTSLTMPHPILFLKRLLPLSDPFSSARPPLELRS